jgi:hypothetical protein
MYTQHRFVKRNNSWNKTHGFLSNMQGIIIRMPTGLTYVASNSLRLWYAKRVIRLAHLADAFKDQKQSQLVHEEYCHYPDHVGGFYFYTLTYLIVWAATWETTMYMHRGILRPLQYTPSF